MKIVIPGGSGQIGSILARQWTGQGHEVVVLARSDRAAGPARIVRWDGETAGDWTREVDGADLLVNLAGRSVDCRYNAANREAIMQSRVRSTRVLRQAVRAAKSPPPVWLNASTATIYRHSHDKPMDEATGELGGGEPGAPAKWDFSIDVAKAWEEEFLAEETPGTRRVAMRSAMTLSPDKGGVFDVILGLVKLGLGGTNGDGRQYFSWVHEADFRAAVDLLARDERFDGVVNIASPNPIPNREFMRTLRRAWGMPVGLPSTAWMMEIGAVFLRTETELVLKSRRVVPGRLLDAGFEFQFPHWEDAARDLCERARGKGDR